MASLPLLAFQLSQELDHIKAKQQQSNVKKERR